MVLGSILEFAGAVGVGARVADTIRTKVVDVDQFEENPALLMVGMMCAILGSSLWLTFCTKVGLTVSTTHSIMGGVIGMGVALVGVNGITWADFSKGDISSGVVSVFLAWIIAPGLSAAFAIIIFLVTKYAVLLRSKPVLRGLMLVPVYFGITAALLVMLIVWKGGSINVNWMTNAQIAGIVVGAGAAWAILVAIFLVPWLYRIVVKDDWQLRWYHIALGPLLLRRPEPPIQPEGAKGGIRDFYEGHLTKEQMEELLTAERVRDEENTANEAKTASDAVSDNVRSDNDQPEGANAPEDNFPQEKKIVGPKPEGPWYNSAVLFWYFKWLFLRGVDQDIVNLQHKRTFLSGDLAAIHSHVPHYDNKAEYLYTFVQIMTACTASFTHGANDVANAIAPYATIYQIWQSGALKGSKSEVPIWIL